MATAAKNLPTVEGSAKAISHWEGSDATLDYNFNLASLTDNGAGDFSPQIGNDMSSASYQVGVNAARSVVGASASGLEATTFAAGSVQIGTAQNGSISDLNDTVISVHGDLA